MNNIVLNAIGRAKNRRQVKKDVAVEAGLVRPVIEEAGSRDFVSEKHSVDSRIYLTEKFVDVDTPAIMNCELYPHQKKCVRAIMDVFKAGFVTVELESEKVSDRKCIAETRSVILSLPLGSGKTFVLIGAILCKTQKLFPNHVNNMHFSGKNFRIENLGYYISSELMAVSNPRFNTEVTRRFGRILIPSLAVVGRSVLHQWESAVRKYAPTLKYLVVENYYSMKKLYDLYKLDQINNLDLIIVKNGNVAGNFVFDGENVANAPPLRSLLNVIALMLGPDTAFSWVVYDDFDTIDIPAGTRLINSCFNIFVSATEKQVKNVVEKTGKPSDEIIPFMQEFMATANPLLEHILHDKVLLNVFNICTEPSFTEASLHVPPYTCYKYVYRNPDDNYMQMLGAMGDTDVNEIVEMLGGDAVGTAAEKLGIQAQRTCDIFEKILGSKHKLYATDVKQHQVLMLFTDIIRALGISQNIGAMYVKLYAKTQDNPDPYEFLARARTDEDEDRSITKSTIDKIKKAIIEIARKEFNADTARTKLMLTGAKVGNEEAIVDAELMGLDPEDEDKEPINAADALAKVLKVTDEYPEPPHENEDDDVFLPGKYPISSLQKYLTRVVNLVRVDPESEYLAGELKQLRREIEASRDKNSLAISRVKENISGGDCQVCCLPLSEGNVIINKCCGVTLCDMCGIKGSHMRATKTAKGEATVMGKCPNCMAGIDITKDVIFINKDYDITKLMSAQGNEAEVIKPKPKKVDEKKSIFSYEHVENPKLRALLNIIKLGNAEAQETTDWRINHLLEGKSEYSVEFNGAQRKVLVFANFEETLINIERCLETEQVQYLRLHGTPKQIMQQVEKFRDTEDIKVLLINSKSMCAGLNIQFATDLVFFHKIIDPSTESQVAGRGQRIGRTCDLKIHYLLYKNEKYDH